MANRDDFSEPTKRYLALRAGYHCSFSNCFKITVGPSDVSPTGVSSIGVAAHICAAAAGGPRHVDSMSAEERSHINNGIWLCADHARLIDSDTVRYTVDGLRRMKRDHEAAISEKLRRESPGESAPDLIGIGPEVICTGSYLEIDSSSWSIRLEHFVVGDMYSLVSFIDGFNDLAQIDRYVVANELGDGRSLAAAPTLNRANGEIVVRCPVAMSFERIEAHELQKDFALSPVTGRVREKGGKYVRVSGLAALPWKLRASLSLLRGESPLHPKAGTRCVEYFSLFRGSPWLEKLLKLEVIRLSAIPYYDPLLRTEYTLLQCVERVRDMRILAEDSTDRRLPIRVDLDVKGVGRWSCDIWVLVETRPGAHERDSSLRK
jgi:hypothetical protein